MIDAESGLTIERDTLGGLPEDVCNGPLRPDCYPTGAKFKRVYTVSLKDADAEGFVRKIGYIDHIVVANGSNLPLSAGRTPNVQDDNEFILLRVPELLRAKSHEVARSA